MIDKKMLLSVLVLATPYAYSMEAGGGPEPGRPEFGVLGLSNLSHGNPLDDKLRQAASFHWSDEAERLIVQEGALVDSVDKMGRTPLHNACLGGSYLDPKHLKATLELFLKHGAKLDARDHDDNTPLHLAQLTGNLRMVELLKEKGADTFVQNNKRQTPSEITFSTWRKSGNY